MAYSSVAITQGSGTAIAVDTVGGLDLQVVKMDVGVSGSSTPLVLTGNGGLPVDILHSATLVVNNPTAGNLKVDASGVAVPVTDNSGSFTVDAPVATPVFVRLSDGTNPIATLPVSGTVTANQGTAAASSGGWPAKITDGTDTVGISTVSATKALKVDVVQSVGIGALADLTAIGNVQTIGGLYNEAPSAPSSGQLGAVRITQKRGLHVTLWSVADTEMGITATPLRTDPTGTTKQPVNLFDSAGNAYTDSNPLIVREANLDPGTGWRKHLAFTASTTITAIRTPTTGKRSYITKIVITILTSGALTICDGADSSTSRLYLGTPPVGAVIILSYVRAEALAAINNVLNYITGTGCTGDLVAEGYEV